MSIAIDRKSSVSARREAALSRLAAAPESRSRRPARANKPAAASVTLGPPPNVFYILLFTVFVFVLLGLVMVMSATTAKMVGGDTSPFVTIRRQAGWALCGAVAGFFAVKVPYQKWRPVVVPAAILVAGAMLLPFVPGVGATINDANSWVRVGTFGFQPSEFLKLAAIVFLADMFARNKSELNDPQRGLVPLALVTMGAAGVCFIQGDLGSAIVLASIILSVGFIAGVPVQHVLLISAGGLMAGAAAIMSSDRRFDRFVSFLDVDGNKEDLGYQSWQGLVSIANGGIFGSGIGGSTSKLGYLPLAHSDFIFAVIADELGLIGSVAVIGGFGVLVWCGMQTALAAPDQFGSILAGGISVWFGIQALINIGGVVGVMPVTGLTLPFLSAGGSSLFVSMIAAGLLLNVALRVVTDQPRTTSRSRSPQPIRTR